MIEKLDKDQDIKEGMVGYFSNILLIDNNLNSLDQNDLITSIPSRIDDILNNYFSSILSFKLIKEETFSFEGEKSPRLGSFPMLFFHKFWHIVSKKVSNFVKELFGTQSPLEEINCTFISIIYNKPRANFVDGFNTIILCNLL